jgi:hypothetical protein
MNRIETWQLPANMAGWPWGAVSARLLNRHDPWTADPGIGSTIYLAGRPGGDGGRLQPAGPAANRPVKRHHRFASSGCAVCVWIPGRKACAPSAAMLAFSDGRRRVPGGWLRPRSVARVAIATTDPGATFLPADDAGRPGRRMDSQVGHRAQSV